MRSFLRVVWLVAGVVLFFLVIVSFFLAGTSPVWDYFALIPQSSYLFFGIFLLGATFFLFARPLYWFFLPLISICLVIVLLMDIVFVSAGAGVTSGTSIKVINWNTALWDESRESSFFSELHRYDADVILLQEVRVAQLPGLVQRVQKAFPGYEIAAQGEFLTISHYPILSSDYPAFQGFSLHTIAIHHKIYSFYNIHLRVPIYGDSVEQSNLYDFNLRRNQFSDVTRKLALDKENVFLAGDFNSTRNYPFIRILEQNLVMNQPEGVLVFPKTYSSRFPAIRIDYQFTNKKNTFVKYRSFGGTISDHFGIYGEFYDNN